MRAAGDHSWTIARTIGILTMQGGFALLEAGSVRPANKANIMMKNVADMSLGLLLYERSSRREEDYFSVSFVKQHAAHGLRSDNCFPSVGWQHHEEIL